MAKPKTTPKSGRKRIAKKIKESVISVVNPDAAGIDIGATEIYVAVPVDRDAKPVRCFTSFTDDLHRLGEWLLSCRVKTVAMESTGVYWIPLYQILEQKGLVVHLVNAHGVKHVPGRKSDVQDCQWLQTLHTNGLLRGSFRPTAAICAMRSIYRHREQLVETAACYTQHIQKALNQMNLQVHHVLSDITGVSGLAMLDAMIQGERDPKVLASLAHPLVRKDRATLERSFVGDWKPEHLFTLTQALESYRFFLGKIKLCDQELLRLLSELEATTEQVLSAEEMTGKKGKKASSGLCVTLPWEEKLFRAFGVNLMTVPGISMSTTLIFLSEVGTDLSRFKSVHHFCSWLRLAPANKASGGRVFSSHTPAHKPRLALALRVAANTLYHSKSALGEQLRRLKAKLGAPKAITAMAHRLARILYAMLTKKQAYDENILATNESKRLRQRQSWLQKQLQSVNLSLLNYQQLAK